MNYVKLNNSTFGLITNFKHEDDLRASFNLLTEDTYGFNFEDWYQNGYWGDRYIPYSLLSGDRIISNVSVSIIDFIIEGRKKTGVQIGTVMTAKEYRNQGLNKFLMEQVLKDWKEKSDFIYLFANDSVLEFYPKFSFEIVEEYQHSKLITGHSTTSKVKKLNIEDEKELELVLETIDTSLPISKVSMRDNTSLIMFYCSSFMKNSIYYVEEHESVVMADYEGDTLLINDVYSAIEVSLKDIVSAMAQKSTKKIVLGFSPKEDTDYEYNILKAEDSTLFILKDHLDLFEDHHWMFPVLSHA